MFEIESLIINCTIKERSSTMLEQFFQAVSEQLKAPKADFEKNMRAWFSDTLDRMDIVSRDTLVRQEKQLAEAVNLVGSTVAAVRRHLYF